MPKSEDDLLDKIKYLLGVMNPMSLESLAFHLEIGLDSLKPLLISFIENKQLNAKIINDSVFSPVVDEMDMKDLLRFKNDFNI